MRELSLKETQVIAAAGRTMTPAVTNITNSNVEGYGYAQAFGISSGAVTLGMLGSKLLAAGIAGISPLTAVVSVGAGLVSGGIGCGLYYANERRNAS